MDFNPERWASHRRGEIVRHQILSVLDSPKSLETIAAQTNKSVRQIKRHIQMLSIEGKTMRLPDGRVCLKVALALLIAVGWTVDGLALNTSSLSTKQVQSLR
ncbi:hypothetical protein [Synechocystis sp. LKSZ1]|uniref:hypothetical protein n=1 Tax=Synechocystis sp. LKSZ1 TaxID=3144951 RepID=UPI00336C2266